MQTQPTVHVGKNSGLFFYLLLLSGCFFLLEISFFIQANKTYLSDFTFVSSQLHIPSAIIPGILFFIAAQLFIHFMYCCLIAIVTFFILYLLPFLTARKIGIGIGLWVLGIITILIANQYFFPYSKFAELTSTLLFLPMMTKILLIGLFGACALSISIACLGASLWALRQLHVVAAKAGIPSHVMPAKAGIHIFLGTLLLSFLSIGFLFFHHTSTNTLDGATQDKPNIIFVGVDSLRPDFLSYFGYEKATPFFDSFLNEATVFGEAITPLARTFPSWTTILSGEYPRQNGIRFNLAQQNHIDTTHLLPEILKQHGYQTVFATDETRFSNMNTHYGFDEIISPPMGLNDFLLGTFNDFPLSNVITNTMVGKWLFPYSYANRPVYFLYDPDSFLQLLNPLLKKSRSQPLFLAVHFCLPHYPYLWASSPVKENNAVARYVASVGRADQQVQDFFVMLQKNHLLDHAIVVLLSDHGEGLEIPGDRITEKESFLVTKSKSIPKFYPPSLDKEAVDESAGHGTDVLGLSQYHTVLAFKLYGFGKQKHRMVPGIVSMLNIKPTVLHLLGLNKEKSLVPVIRGTQEKVAVPKHIFLESIHSPSISAYCLLAIIICPIESFTVKKVESGSI